MIIGYDAPRPDRSQYDDFQEKFVEGLNDLEIEGLSYMDYGSFSRGNYVPGRSDVDGVLVFPDKGVINKENLRECSIVLAHALGSTNIPFQVSVYDIATLQDGRYSTFTADFEEYFNEEARVLVGPDYRSQISYDLEKSGVLHTSAFNLRKARKALLFAEHDQLENYSGLVTGFGKCLEGAVNATKQVAFLCDGNLRSPKFSSVDFIRERFPDLDAGVLDLIKRLYENPTELDDFYQSPSDMKKLMNSSVDFFEGLVQGYTLKYPRERT